MRQQAKVTALILSLFGLALILAVSLAQADTPAPPPHRVPPPVSPISPVSPIWRSYLPALYSGSAR